MKPEMGYYVSNRNPNGKPKQMPLRANGYKGYTQQVQLRGKRWRSAAASAARNGGVARNM